jgi:hypothetical protein
MLHLNEWQRNQLAVLSEALLSPDFLRSVVGIFEAKAGDIASLGNVGQASDQVLAKVRDGLQGLGFKVETAKTAAGKIKVPVLYGRNGKIEKSFDADAFHPEHRVVLEVEAGRGVTNHQFLKDLFQACVMQDVDYAVIAVRNDYRESDDFDKVCRFLETIYASGRLVLPLKGVLIIGY